MNEIICGDAATEMEKMPDETFDAIITSPPYAGQREYTGMAGQGAIDFLPVARQIVRLLKPGGSLVWIYENSRKGHRVIPELERQIIWFSENGLDLWQNLALQNLNGRILRVRGYEWTLQSYLQRCPVFSKGEPRKVPGLFVPTKTAGSVRVRKNTGIHTDKIAGVKKYLERTSGRPVAKYKNASSVFDDNTEYFREENGEFVQLSDTWELALRDALQLLKFPSGCHMKIDQDIQSGHPAIMPYRPIAAILEYLCKPGDAVLDMFCGAGTVPRLCADRGISFCGIDISPEYCEISRKLVAASQKYLFNE